MPRDVYCYDGDADEPYADPHAVVITISDEDARYWRNVREREDEHLGRWEVGTFVDVTDLRTGRAYQLATAPCGQPCRCAAIAVAMKEEVVA